MTICNEGEVFTAHADVCKTESVLMLLLVFTVDLSLYMTFLSTLHHPKDVRQLQLPLISVVREEPGG